jgi:hypothetical protein
MKIVEYVAAHDQTHRAARADFATIEQLLSLPWVAKHRGQRGFIRFSITNGDTLIMEYEVRGMATFKVFGRISEPDPKVLAELPIWLA